ncbi:uncharacterized protein [Aristolochia californica]|uniref:uncharacterized protein n=1 Tax=Aristolochia californica TaxID=171875 RepID=UPI0035D77B61
MGAQGKSLSSVNSMQRVKVYRLSDDGKWEDRGTGHVTVDYLERSEDLGLFVIDEEDNDTLLVHRIASDEIYRKQEDTIISWRDPDFSTELALSFQESTGCAYIWDHICTVQRNLQFNALSNVESGPRPATESLEASGASQTNDETYQNINNELREFPAVELSTLPLILKTVVESGVPDQMRAVDLILHDQDFFPKVMELFRICEDLENIDGLHMIFKIVKGIILLNSPQIFDKIFGEEFIMDIIGCLEYDPDVCQVQNHRSFLKEHVVFKEAIPIKDSIVLSRIHQTYRVAYIKDIILPRVLDDATVANLNSIVHGNNAVVVSLLKDDSTFIQELFARMKFPTTDLSKKNLVLFLQEFCSLSKSLQLVQQLRLFRDLVSEGIFDIITDVLQSPDKRLVLTGTDILLLFLNQDPNLLRTYIIQQEGNTLLGLLVKGMLTDFGEDMHCQFLEIIRILLDSYTLSGSQRDTIVEIFYDKYLGQLIEVIVASCPPKDVVRSKVKAAGSYGSVEKHTATKPEILSNICELLCFCVLHHPYRIKCNFILNNVVDKVLFLTRRRERYLIVAAVRFLRTIISRNDEHLLRHVVKSNTLKPIVEVFVDNGNRYNLLHSAILELFEYIRKENLKTLVVHIVDTFWDQLVKFEPLGSIHALKVRYEQLLESCETRNSVNVTDPRKRIDDRALEKEEEDYFNEDSDEEDSASVRTSNARSRSVPHGLPNGTGESYPSLRPGAGGLVDYEDDDDDEDYNPPTVNKQETVSVDEKRSDSFKLKRRSSVVHSSNDEEQFELTKKRRIEKNTNGGTRTIVGPCSTCSGGSSPSKKVVSSNNPRVRDENSGPDQASGETSSGTTRNCAKCSPDAAEMRQTEIPISNSSAETAAKVTGSVPYSVR